MTWPKLFNISLARKCQLLFGLAVLLIIAATLFVPGYYSEMLVHELNARSTRQLAIVARARINPSTVDWDREQKLLDQWWQDNEKELGFPPDTRPRLIPIPPVSVEGGPTINAVLKVPAEPPRWLRRTAGIAEELAQTSLSWQVIQVAAALVPVEFRTRLSDATRTLVPRTARLVISRDWLIDPTDTTLVYAVREMQSNKSYNERSITLYDPGKPRAYRCILAVRGVSEEAGRRPVVAVIDVTRRMPSNSDIILTRTILVLAGVLAGFLAILVFYLVSQRLILAPVRELKACAERIAGGDLRARADLSTGDEFQELSDAFNDMLSQLERARDELETINRSLDIKLGELAQTNVALYEANKLKSEFLANVSHELRTPLTSIIGFADLLRDSAAGEVAIDKTRLARYAHNILTSGRGLLEIINDLLDLAKIEAGRIELHRGMFSVRDVCDALYDLTRPLFDKKSITFEMELAEDLPMMNSDAGKIRQILYNLLSNASKYTPEAGNVRLDVVPIAEGQSVRMIVTDTGPGIAPEHQKEIFEKFRQLDSSVTREHSGTGLGLAITKELAIMLGGVIRLESELGKGSRFIVDLPVECPSVVQRSLPSLM